MTEELFTTSYFDQIESASSITAKTVVPWLREWFAPESVIDVGCGNGVWLSEFEQQGVSQIMGMDGSYLNKDILRISEADFVPTELAALPEPKEQYDMAICLEAAQYVSADKGACIVDFLTRSAGVVMFSSAVPGQPGKHHANPQWPSYWIHEFAQRGYQAFDPIRHRIWHQEDIPLHYRQNLLVYIHRQHHRFSHWEVTLPKANCLHLVDEDTLTQQLSLKSSLKRIPRLVLKKLIR